MSDITDRQFLEEIKELTAGNEHTLALWRIARQCGLHDFRLTFGDMLAEQMSTNGVSDELEQRRCMYRQWMLIYLERKYGAEVREKVRLCL